MAVLRRKAKERRWGWLAGLFFLCLFLGLSWLHSAGAQTPVQLDEQKVKAGLIYNLLKYTAWPQDSAVVAKKEIQVCIFGNDMFQGSLEPMQGRTAQQYRINIQHVQDPATLTKCNLIFISRSEAGTLSGILRMVQDNSILTVSDIQGFSKKGGMVEMTVEDNRVHLYMNIARVRRAGLAMQDRLLRLSKMVISP